MDYRIDIVRQFLELTIPRNQLNSWWGTLKEMQQPMILDKDFKYFLDNQEELVKKHNGKYLVIKDEAIRGVYDSELEAYTEAKKQFELGTFLIQHCLPGTEGYKQTFHSRVYLGS